MEHVERYPPRQSDRQRGHASGLSRFRTLLVGGLAAIGAMSAAFSANAGPTDAELAKMKLQYQRPETVPFPKDNPFSQAKVDLGHKLFFDPRLSGTSTMSCASCHNPGLSWGDGLATGVGSAANKLGRRSPTILNLAWAESLMWDGRAGSLEEQATGPIEAKVEMNQSMPRLLTTLGDIPGYRAAFQVAFPGEPISAKTIAKAIATFERTVVSGQAPFDRWIEGDEKAIDDAAKRGFVTFNTKANCSACHSGWRFTDDSFHDIGLTDGDLGKGKLVPGVEPLLHAFKTPGLRNIAGRAPYMHNGSVTTMATVVRHYSDGFVQRPSLSPEVYKLKLTENEIHDLVAFLKTLTSTDATIAVPVLPISEVN